MTHKVFFKYFIAIFSLCILSTVIVVGFVFANYNFGKENWMDDAFESFSEKLTEEINRLKNPRLVFSVIDNALKEAINDRISGYIVYDADHNYIMRFGRVPRQQSGITKLRNQKTIDLNIQGNSINASLSFNQVKNKVSKDVIGTLEIASETQPFLYIDVLAFSPADYDPLEPIVSPLKNSLTLALPFYLLLSALGAWLISKRNSKSIREIRNSLNELAQGKEEVQLNNFKTAEYIDIAHAVNDLDKSLQANKKSRRAWLNSISHDLNTPVMAMKLLIDGINDKILLPSEENLKKLQQENDNLAKKVSKVIYFSSLQGNSKIKKEAFTTDRLLDQTLSEGVNVTVNSDSHFGNLELIQRALEELLENAKNFKTDNNSINLIVDQNRIIVQNSGKITSDNLFEPWTKEDYSRGFEGNGLGLPIVGTIARLHDGEATISEKDNLVTATIRWQPQDF